MCTCVHIRRDVNVEPGSITAQNALQLISNYKESEGWRDDETRAVWFSLSRLKEIYEMIKDIPDGDGVRIYFAKYADKDDSIPTDYQSRKTLVMIPTVAKTEEGILFHKNIFDVEALVDDLPAAEKISDHKAYNHGDLCPPYCL